METNNKETKSSYKDIDKNIDNDNDSNIFKCKCRKL